MWDLHNKALAETGAHLGPGPWDDDLKDIETVYLQNKGEFLVAELDGSDGKRIIGMGAFRRIDDSTAEIKRMRVYREFQGKGIGKAVLRELEKKAGELGYTMMKLDTTTMQSAAQRLYSGFGYREVHRNKGDGHEVIFFEKQL